MERRVTVRMTAELHDALKELARRDRRSVAMFVLMALEGVAGVASPSSHSVARPTPAAAPELDNDDPPAPTGRVATRREVQALMDERGISWAEAARALRPK